MSMFLWLRLQAQDSDYPREVQSNGLEGACLSFLQKEISALYLGLSFTFLLFLPPSFLHTLIVYRVYSTMPLNIIVMGSTMTWAKFIGK